LWWWGDSLFFKIPHLKSDALLTMLHPLLESVLHTVDHFKICLRAPFSWLEKPRNSMGQDLDCMVDVLMGFHRSTFSKPNTEFKSVVRSWRVVRSVSLAKGGTSKKRLSPHLHKVSTQSNKVSPRTLQTALDNISIGVISNVK
jgi:hypothetical protein